MTVLALPAGRPTTYSDDLAERVVALYADGKGFREIAQTDGMPSWSTLYEWEEKRDDFRNALARARREKARWAAGEAGSVLGRTDPDAEPRQTSSARVQLANSKSAYYRWLAGCLDRETWGERPAQAPVVNNTIVVSMSRLGMGRQEE